MDVAKWAEIHRLKKIEGLSNRAIGERMGCSHKTVAKALKMAEPPTKKKRHRDSILDPFKAKIEELIERYPTLSAVRVHEEIRKQGFEGDISVVRKHLKKIRLAPKQRVYLEGRYDKGEALQVDWGHCGSIKVGDRMRKLYVFVGVLCYSRLLYLEFFLSIKKEDFYRGIVNALNFIGGVPKKIIFDNLKAAVIDGSGKTARLHPEFLALCGHYLMEPIACARRDPESKGRVEAGVGYIKKNALAGYEDSLRTFVDYQRHAVFWRDQVANVRLHGTTKKKPVFLLEEERPYLRALPEIPFDTDVILPVVANSMARIIFDCNRYSVPPALARKALTLRASSNLVILFDGGVEVARHFRSYEKGKLFVLNEHLEEALGLRKKQSLKQIECRFEALGTEAKKFRQELIKRPLKPSIHMKKILKLAHIYGKTWVMGAIAKALEFGAIDSAYVENILHQQRRKARMPSPIPLSPLRKELLEEVDFEESDLSEYDKLFDIE